jgi:transaldolase/glucose-6-phosphate isomerase
MKQTDSKHPVHLKGTFCMTHTKNDLNPFSYKLPPDLESAVCREITEWTKSGKLAAEWNRKSSVWTGSGEEKWLGWLDIASREMKLVEGLEKFALSIRDEGYRHVVLLGMGGSSLCAEVIEKPFGLSGVKRGFPDFRILDSTDPLQIRDLEESISIEDTLFIVSSKSGSTLEPNILFEYFFHRVKECVGKSDAGAHFLAITDPGSTLETRAKEHGFTKIFHGDPSIGGRYSVLSNFGMVPAALMGVDLKKFLSQTQLMVGDCGPDVSPSKNPGVLLGAILVIWDFSSSIPRKRQSAGSR